MKNIRIFIWKLSFFGGEIFNISEKACFRNDIYINLISRELAFYFFIFPCSNTWDLSFHVLTFLKCLRQYGVAVRWVYLTCIVLLGFSSNDFQEPGFFFSQCRWNTSFMFSSNKLWKMNSIKESPETSVFFVCLFFFFFFFFFSL